MAKDSFSVRLHEARVMAKLSMDKLVERMGGIITKQSVSRYENGIMHPKSDALDALCRALHISEAYFKGENIRLDLPMLRTTSHDRLTAGQLAVVEARLTFWAERYLAKEQSAGFRHPFENPLAAVSVTTLEDAIRAADRLRQCWRCGDGPIASLLRLLERKGIKILSTELPDTVLGLSTWADGCHPLIVLDMRPEKTSTEQIRFTAAHELAHLLLPLLPDSDQDAEKCCNQFASFFLFPRKTFIEEMGSGRRDELTLDEMTDLKEVYGLSIAAQVHEAWDLRMISREHYDWWFNERIKKNRKETGWGQYPVPETLGWERRLESVIGHNSKQEEGK